MATTGSKLVELSGLTGVSAAQHLIAAGGTGATAGSMLVSISSLAVATALEHLNSASGVIDTTVDEWRRPQRMRRVTKWRKPYYRLG